MPSTNFVSALIDGIYQWANPIFGAWLPWLGVLLGITLVFIVGRSLIDYFSYETNKWEDEMEEKVHTANFFGLDDEDEPSIFHPKFGSFFGNLRHNLTQRDDGMLFQNKREKAREKRYEKYALYADKEDAKRAARYEKYKNSKYNTPENNMGVNISH